MVENIFRAIFKIILVAINDCIGKFQENPFITYFVDTFFIGGDLAALHCPYGVFPCGPGRTGKKVRVERAQQRAQLEERKNVRKKKEN